MIAVKVRFDGKVLVPEEAVELPTDRPLVAHVEIPNGAAAAGPTPGKQPGVSVLDWLAANAVAGADLPADLSSQLDHYLYGTPK